MPAYHTHLPSAAAAAASDGPAAAVVASAELAPAPAVSADPNQRTKDASKRPWH